MAERGGYRLPKDRGAKAPGVGKNSKRTDAQPIRAPNVQEGTDLAIGDRQRLEAGMRTQPLGRTQTPRVQPRAMPAGGGKPMEIPEHLFSSPTNRPLEPDSEGSPFGPGAGPEVLSAPPPRDVREEILEALVSQFGDDATSRMLNDMRAQRETPAAPMPTALTPAPEMQEAEMELAGSPEDEMPADLIEAVPPGDEEEAAL